MGKKGEYLDKDELNDSKIMKLLYPEYPAWLILFVIFNSFIFGILIGGAM